MPLFDEELLVLRPSSTRVSGRHSGTIHPSDLAGIPFLLYPKRSNMRLVIDRFFKEIEVTPRVVMEADDTETIKRLVESGFGNSILPEHALRQRTRFFRTFRVEGHHLTRSLALATVSTEYPRKLTDSIANFLLTLLRS
jgi:DNA-binding transcriptional LysR family regulator